MDLSLLLATVWYVPGWNRTAETDGPAFAACTNAYASEQCAFYGWDGDCRWETAVANADSTSARLAEAIAATNESFRANLTLVGHSLGARIVARTLARLAEKGYGVRQGVLLAPAIPADDPDLATTGRGSKEPVLLVVNPQDTVLKYVYPTVGGEPDAPLGLDGARCPLKNVVEYSVPENITEATEVPAFWGRSASVKRLCNHLAVFYFNELGRILKGTPSANALVRVPQDNVNVEWKVLDQGVWWQLEAAHKGWKLERNRLTGHCRVLDPKTRRVAWGCEEKMRAAFEKVVRQRP